MKKKSRRKNKEWIKKKLNGKIAFYSSLLLLVIPIVIVFAPIDYEFKSDMINNPVLSLTLVFIFAVPFFIIGFCYLRRKWIYGFEKGGVHCKNAELYYSHGMNNIRSIIMVYVIGISLLWGFVISSPITGEGLKLIDYKLEYNLSDADLSKDGSYYWVNESLTEIQSRNSNLYKDIIEQGLIVSIVTWLAIFVYYVSLVEDFKDVLKDREDDSKKHTSQKGDANEVLKLKLEGEITKK